MTDDHEKAGFRKGVLRHGELDEIVRSYVNLRPFQEIDDQASAFLAQRGATTDWETTERQKGTGCLALLQHRVFDRLTFGDIYDVMLAQHLFLGRIDVVKVLRRDKSNMLPEPAACHLRRARAQGAIDSARIVKVHDAAYHRGVYYVVVEHVPGLDLFRAVNERGKLSVGEAAQLGVQVAFALEELHSYGLIHGALRPTKVLMSDTGAVKLVDAGTAATSGRFYLREHAHIMRRAYLAPEVARGGDISPLSDIYLLGCVLYFAVTGVGPFSDGVSADRSNANSEERPLARELLCSDLDDGFCQIIIDMIASTPSQRIQSIVDVVERLQPWLASKA